MKSNRPPAKAKHSGWKHVTQTSSRHHLSRRILTGKRRASRYYRLAKQQLAEREMEEDTR